MSGAHEPRGERALTLIDRERIVADTCDLIRARSENPGGTEAEAAGVLQRMCERIGATVRLQEWAPGRVNLHAGLGPEDAPALLFLGHSDVVPAGEGWSGDPFAPEVRDGAIIGRGASDMKGGLAAVVAAMAAVHAVAPELRLELLCTADEEDRAQGVEAWLAAEQPRDYIGCVVAEPTDLDIVIGCRGASNFVVDIVGASAHAGRPEDGASSIYAAAQVIDLVRADHDALRAGAADPLLGTATWNVGTVTGGSGTSMVPRITTLAIDRRTLPGERPEEILTELLDRARERVAAASFAGAATIEITGTLDMQMPGFRVAADDPLPAAAAAALTVLELPVTVTGWTAACEGGFVAEFHQTPTIIFGPGSINDEAHQPDEKVRIDELIAAARAYAVLVFELTEAKRPDAVA